MISPPSRFPEGRTLSIYVDGDVRNPTYGNSAVQKARLAYYETCMNNPISDAALCVDSHLILKRLAGNNEITITEYGELLGFAHDVGGDGGDNDNIRRVTLRMRIPEPLPARVEDRAGKRGMNAFIAEAMRDKLQRDETI